MGQLSLPLWTTTDRTEPRERTSSETPHATSQDSAGLQLAARLGTLLREPVEVELTDNAWTMVSWKRVEGRLQYRLHHMFCGAAEPLLRALAGFAGKNRKLHGAAIDEFVRTHRHLIKSSLLKAEPSLAARGRVHDLIDIYDQLNAQQFELRVKARIGWGRRPPDGRRRSIKMGVYFHEQKVIRIHPALDDEQVPRHFVGLVVFHEMLHQVLPPTTDGGGRRTVHGRDFRAAERRFPDYERARAWEKANLHLLLRRRD